MDFPIKLRVLFDHDVDDKEGVTLYSQPASIGYGKYSAAKQKAEQSPSPAIGQIKNGLVKYD